MDKLEQMEIMSNRLEQKCRTFCLCQGCPLRKKTYCYVYNEESEFDRLRENCKLMDIDISDLDEPPRQKERQRFTKSDIESGYLLKLKGDKFVIATGEKRNIFFHYFDIANSKINGYAFCLDDIKDDFTALADIAIISIYGHTSSKSLGLNDRLILWERNGTECKIYNIETEVQSIRIKPNANTYLTGDKDGDIYIENMSDLDECLCIKRKNLSGLISALQEIQELYNV